MHYLDEGQDALSKQLVGIIEAKGKVEERVKEVSTANFELEEESKEIKATNKDLFEKKVHADL